MQWFVGLDPRFYSFGLEMLPGWDGTLDIVNSSELRMAI